MSAPEPTVPGTLEAGEGEVSEEQRSVLPPLEVDDATLVRGIAGVLFVSDEPVSTAMLAETLGIDVARCARAVESVGVGLGAADLGIELREVAGGWRLMTSTVGRAVLERWVVGSRHGRLTQAALETLAVVAYRQPITRATIGEVRGVNPDGALRSLVARGLVEEVGREEGPGQAVLFGTTTQFLERMGLRSLDELPAVPPYLPDGPAPDEPEAGGIGELRRRLREGSARLGGPRADAAEGATGVGGTLAGAGAMDDSEDDEDDAMGPPTRRRPPDDAAIGDLSERLEQAARSAMGRLRSLRSADEPDEPDEAEEGEESEGGASQDPTAEGAQDG